ncbi:MAG: sterol desaturase family protein [Betaproteobacteria bacterium]|nr:sterol desaturase family protein [Betaproteobacteria bacterium]
MEDFALLLILLTGALFVLLEHLFPAHPLEPRLEWYVRAVLVNAVQVFVYVGVEHVWTKELALPTLGLGADLPPFAGAMLAYFIFTFAIYWWHRARHGSPILWRIFHQFHHSPRRIQALTAYYIHPLDMLVGLSISNAIMFPLLGLNSTAAAWYALITGFAGFFIHANIRVPRIIGYVYQTPEMHRLHHKSGHHANNYSDIVCWDMMFGTYCNPTSDIETCGFDGDTERDVVPLLIGKKIS